MTGLTLGEMVMTCLVTCSSLGSDMLSPHNVVAAMTFSAMRMKHF